MDGCAEAQREVRSWLLRYLSELVWETFRKAATPLIDYDRRVICLAEASLEKKEQLDEVDQLVQHFIGLVFHVGVIMDHIEHGQLSDEIVELIRTSGRHWAQVRPDTKKHDESSGPEYDLVDDLKLQALLAFLKRTTDLNSASDLCDKLWPGDCSNAKRAQIRSTLSSGTVTVKDSTTLKHDVTACLAAVHSSFPDCLLLEFVQDLSAAGLSQSSVCKPLSPRFTVEGLVKSYWRRKLLLPLPAGNARRHPVGRHSEPSSLREIPSVRLFKTTRTERASRASRDADTATGSSSEDEPTRAAPVPADDGVHDRVTSRYFAANKNRTNRSMEQPIDRSSSEQSDSERVSPAWQARLHRRYGREPDGSSSTHRRAVSFAADTDGASGSGPSKRLKHNAMAASGPPARNSGLKYPSKKRQRWSANDEERLYKGVQQFGCSKWLLIKHRLGLLDKTAVQIKDKWRNIMDNRVRMRALAAKLGPLNTELASTSYQLRSNST